MIRIKLLSIFLFGNIVEMFGAVGLNIHHQVFVKLLYIVCGGFVDVADAISVPANCFLLTQHRV